MGCGIWALGSRLGLSTLSIVHQQATDAYAGQGCDEKHKGVATKASKGTATKARSHAGMATKATQGRAGGHENRKHRTTEIFAIFVATPS
jgi:hypothetical protein